jgi:pyruvate kinase
MEIGARKNMNLPGVVVDLPTLTDQDVIDVVEWGVGNNVDFIAASFVRKASDIAKIRQTLGEAGAAICIIAKIENQEGLERFDEILAATDGIMVARGDLGMEIPSEKVFLAQKMMIRKCNIAGKPVVTATQMLESMITNPRPTRAECSDVANAILDGSDAVMLSGETANGEHPEAAVTIMSKTCIEAEQAINFNELCHAIKNSILATYGQLTVDESVASSAVKTAIDLNCKLIIVLTESGKTARIISQFRPPMPCVALTPNEVTLRQCSGIYRHTKSRLVKSMVEQDVDEIVTKTMDDYVAAKVLTSGDCVVLVFGLSSTPSKYGSKSMKGSNTVRVLSV